MISLLYSTWIESFQFFISPDSRLYPLLALNTILRTIKTLFLYFFWLIPLALYSYVHLRQDLLDLSPTSHSFSFASFSGHLVEILLFFAIILSTRTSLEPKCFSYFMYFSPRIVAFSLLWTLPYILWVAPNMLILPFICIISFFFFDSSFSIKSFAISCINGIKMILLFFPLFFITTGASLGFIYIIKLPYILLNSYLPNLPISPLIMDFTFTLMSNIVLTATLSILYITLKHRHYKLFFAE